MINPLNEIYRAVHVIAIHRVVTDGVNAVIGGVHEQPVLHIPNLRRGVGCKPVLDKGVDAVNERQCFKVQEQENSPRQLPHRDWLFTTVPPTRITQP